MTEPLLVVNNLTYSLNDGRKLIECISFSIEPDTITTIIGPNGGGKTTLIRCLLGLLTPTDGTISKKDNLRIAYLPQKLSLDASLPMTVELLLSLAPSFDRENYDWLVENLDLKPILQTSIHSLSGGERQRAFLARTLMSRPHLLVLDEPAQGVDLARQTALYALIEVIRKRYRCAVLLVSHDLMLVMRNTNLVLCLNKHICCSGHPHQVASANEFRELFGHVVAQNLQDIFAVYEHDMRHDHSHSHLGSCCDAHPQPVTAKQ